MTAYLKAGPHAAALQQVTVQALLAPSCRGLCTAEVQRIRTGVGPPFDDARAVLMQGRQQLSIPAHEQAAKSAPKCESDQEQRPTKLRKRSSDSAAA